MVINIFDKATVEFPCPRCGFYNAIFVKQIRLRDVVICRGCKANIQMDDHMNENRNAARNIRRSLQRLRDSFRKMTVRL